MNKKTPLILTFFLLISYQSISNADSKTFEIKSIKDFKTLESYKSVDKFDAYIAKYVNNCVDNWGGSAAGSRCLIGYDMWDRELNIYYHKLRKSLKNKKKNELKTSQKAWLKSRDLSRKFISNWISKEYKEPGTMYIIMKASDADYALTSIVKQRALTLRRWFRLINNKCHNEPTSTRYKY
jgi:uncharacterized protein YecT (DUF1311 family)